MKRTVRAVIVTLALGVLTAPLGAGGQPAVKVPRIGVFQVGLSTAGQHFFDAFREGMRERGYVEGQNIIIERRSGENRPERVRDALAELVAMPVDVIVTSTDQGIAAARQRTRTIPIVMANSTDPVATGFAASLARPGGNVTGHSNMSPELSGKRLELLKEVVPGLLRVAVLWTPDVRGAVLDYRETHGIAQSLQIQVQSYELSRLDDLEQLFASMTAERAQAILVPPANPLVFGNRMQIVRLAQRVRLPAMYGLKDFVDAGGLMAYGPNPGEQWRHAAVYVDKILKGARAADLPIEQPTKFELSINLKTAKALGLTIPPSLVRRADHVVQ
jgi:ABC-type uncharacterized transport system substrate-binding protein